MLREMVDHYPDGTKYTIVERDWRNDIRVSDGQEALTIDAALNA